MHFKEEQVYRCTKKEVKSTQDGQDDYMILCKIENSKLNKLVPS